MPSREEIEWMEVSARMGDRHLFTPLLDGERIRIYISPADSKRITMAGRCSGFKGEVTDLDTGKRYQVHGAPCSLPECYCDAYVVPLPGN